MAKVLICCYHMVLGPQFIWKTTSTYLIEPASWCCRCKALPCAKSWSCCHWLNLLRRYRSIAIETWDASASTEWSGSSRPSCHPTHLGQWPSSLRQMSWQAFNMPGFDTVWSVTCSPKQMNWQINSCGKVWTRSSPAKVGTQAIKYSAEALWTSSHGSKKTSANVGQTYFFVSYLDCMSYFRKLLFLQPFDQGLDGSQAGRRGDRFAKGGQEPFHFPLEATSIYQVYPTWKGKCQ